MKLVNGYKLKTMLYLKGKQGIGKSSPVNFFKVYWVINVVYI